MSVYNLRIPIIHVIAPIHLCALTDCVTKRLLRRTRSPRQPTFGPTSPSYLGMIHATLRKPRHVRHPSTNLPQRHRPLPTPFRTARREMRKRLTAQLKLQRRKCMGVYSLKSLLRLHQRRDCCRLMITRNSACP